MTDKGNIMAEDTEVDGFEVHPLDEEGDIVDEDCHEPARWGVYMHRPHIGITFMKSYATKEDALKVEALISKIIKSNNS